jgi:hypothetical protein
MDKRLCALKTQTNPKLKLFWLYHFKGEIQLLQAYTSVVSADKERTRQTAGPA